MSARKAAPAGKSPRMLDAPLGQGLALQRIVRNARQLRMHHGLIVCGPGGAGKTTVARWIAAALLCASDIDLDGPCGTCRSCRRVATSQHPDFHEVSVLEGKRDIAIEQLRNMQGDLQRLAIEGRARVVVIDPAESLNEPGQNALLKTLEEPGESTFLLLVTSRLESLLPTVRSRCESLQVLRLTDEVVAQQLELRNSGLAKNHAQAVLLARGRLGVALEACTEQAVQMHDLVQELGSHTKPLRAVATARAVIAGSEGRAGATQRARMFLELVRNMCSGRLHALAEGNGGSYVPAPTEPWTSIAELTLFAEKDLDLQIPAEQALCGLFLQWSRLLPQDG
ncbi:MAG: AAA family ATPase [Planctomycetota bacterium]|nr:AAA family ATPase [Planctomycetota bacterium]